MAVLDEYKWLVVMGAFVAFGFAWGTGANDVANAFGTSVGSKTLTLRQAVLIASVFEFAGALLLGRVSTNTIASGIANIDAFTRDPEVYAYGMVCALAVGTIWLIMTSYWGLILHGQCLCDCAVRLTRTYLGRGRGRGPCYVTSAKTDFNEKK